MAYQQEKVKGRCQSVSIVVHVTIYFFHYLILLPGIEDHSVLAVTELNSATDAQKESKSNGVTSSAEEQSTAPCSEEERASMKRAVLHEEQESPAVAAPKEDDRPGKRPKLEETL